MFEMNASEKLNSLNAYVTGIGASKRVVVWDTTTKKMNTGEILFVFGHEMGHYVLNHVWMGIGAACLGILVALLVGYRAMHWALGRWGARWAIRGVDDWASLPVLLMVAAVLNFVGEPISSSIGRVLEQTNNDTAAEDALRQSLEINPEQPEVIQHWIALRQRQCKWPVMSEWGNVKRARLTSGLSPLSAASFTDDPLFQLATAFQYSRKSVGFPAKAVAPGVARNR